jgi:hypothetical protein
LQNAKVDPESGKLSVQHGEDTYLVEECALARLPS